MKNSSTTPSRPARGRVFILIFFIERVLPLRIMDSVTSPRHRSMSIAFPREKRERKAIETAVQGGRSSALNACKFLVDSGKLFTAVSGRYTFPRRINRSTERARQRDVHCVTRIRDRVHRLAYDRIGVYRYACNVKVRTYIYLYSVPPGGKPPCSACAILLISGIEACPP